MATASALGLAKGLVYAKVLDPTEFGYYGIQALVLQFGLYLSNWGLLNALNNHLPIAFGRGREDAGELADRSLGGLLVTSLITAAVYLAVVFTVSPGNEDVQVALALASVTTFVSTFTEFHVLMLRVQRRIVPMASMYVLRAVLAIVLGVVGGALWGYVGVICAEVAALLVVLITARRVWLPQVHVERPSRPLVLRLIRAGGPLMLGNVIVTLSVTADRIFVASALPDEFGQYAFASLVVVAWLAIVGMLDQAVAPRLLHDYGAGTRLRDVRREAIRLAVAFTALGGVGLLALLLVKGPLERGWLAEYALGLDAMPILWLGGMLMLLAFPSFILGAIRPTWLLAASAIAALVAIGGGAVLAAGDASLNDFAWLFVASRATALVTLSVALGLETRGDRVSPDVFGT